MLDQPAPDLKPNHETRLATALRSSMVWNIANMGASQLITIGVFIFLTYKLDAAVFGTFALAAIIIDYFHFSARSSAVDAFVQRRDFSPKMMDTAFWVCLAVVFGVIVVCVFSGYLFAVSLGEPKLTYVMPALALTLLPVPWTIPTTAVLLRDHDFKGLAVLGIVSAIAGGAAAVIVVMSPFPEWALVVQRGVQTVASSAIVVIRAGWWPKFQFAATEAKSYLHDVTRIFAAQAVAGFTMRILDVVVAIGFGTAAVGFMRIASRMADAVNGTFVAPISSLWVLFLSERAETPADRALMYIRLSQMSALIVLPIFAGMALTSAELVEIALADSYKDVGPILTVLSAAGLLAPLAYFLNAALIAVRRLNFLLALNIADIVFLTIAAVLLMNISVIAVVASIIIVDVLRTLLAVPILLREMNAKAAALLQAVWPAYAACLVMAVAVVGVGQLLSGHGVLVHFAAEVVTGAAAYFGYLALFHREWSIVALSMLLPGRFRTPETAGAPTNLSGAVESEFAKPPL